MSGGVKPPEQESKQRSPIPSKLDPNSKQHIEDLKQKGHLIAADVELQSDCDKIQEFLKSQQTFTSFDAVSYKVKRVAVIKEFYIVKVFTGDRRTSNQNQDDYHFVYIVKEEDNPFDASRTPTWEVNPAQKCEKDILECN